MTNRGLGEKLFQFAIISDTHVNPTDTECNSPFPVNARANRRFRHVIRELNQRDVSFVVHLGDLVHPVPTSGRSYVLAAEAYKKIVAELNVPIYVVPGNHDIGDKPGAGGPVPTIGANEIEIWKSTFGDQNGVVLVDDLKCIMLNAQLINSGLPDELVQKDWVEREIAEWQGRIMLMLHHPPFICTPDESEHYDNLAEPGRTWFLTLLQSPKVVATFGGHAHNFWYDRIDGTDYYRLPATSFVRQDYLEMLHAPPGEDTEFGRDDRAKLGYFIVEVFEFGHTVQMVRTYGYETGPDDTTKKAPSIANPPIINQSSIVGFDLRHNWAEITEIAPSGALDEFDRKPARNDYPLMGLMEMGVRDIRIPMSDLRCHRRRERLAAMQHLGFRIALFFSGIPTREEMKLIAEASEWLSTLEIAIPKTELEGRFSELRQLNEVAALSYYLSPIHNAAPSQGGVHKHVIEHGVAPHDDELFALMSSLRGAGCLGAVHRVHCDQLDAQILTTLQKKMERFDLQASVHLRTGSTIPALANFSEKSVLEALVLCHAQKINLNRLKFYLDTLITQDRGYFPRCGALDPNCNPTRIAALIAQLNTKSSDPS